MKNLLPLLTIVCLFLFSCEKEAQQETQNADITTPDLRPGPGANPDPCCGEENLFERQLQWFSYIAAEIVATNPHVKTQFSNLYSNSIQDAFLITDLIGPSTEVPAFNTAFYNTLVYHIENPLIGNPDSSQGTPPPPPTPGSFPDGTPGELIADAYYNFMLNENCIELYFPNSLDISGITPEITSTSHPLTTSGANEGRRWYFNSLQNAYAHPPAVVNPFYAANHTNIFVARPYRPSFSIPNGIDCDYDEYSGIDFEDFLD